MVYSNLKFFEQTTFIVKEKKLTKHESSVSLQSWRLQHNKQTKKTKIQ